MENNAETHFYVMLSKRYLSRYVLTYELLPLECCHDVNGGKIFDGVTMNAMLEQNKVSDKNVIIELNANSSDTFQSYTNIKSIGFTSKESLESFTDISFENYDLSALNLYVMDTPHESKPVTIETAEPETIDKISFSQKVALNDAITASIHKTLITHPQFGDEIQKYKGDAEVLLQRIISLYIDDTADLSMAVAFFRICSHFHIDNGWQPEEVISEFGKRLENNADVKETVDVWVDTARKLLNNEDIPLSYSDDQNIVLRAMTLVFLNPEQKNIDSLKLHHGENLGTKVYALADLFVSARTGYSYLSAEQRKQINSSEQLHDVSASLYNPVSDIEDTEPYTLTVDVEITDSDNTGYSLEQESWLTNHTEHSYKLNGVKPMAGFDLTIEYKPDSTLAWRVIDANSEKGMDKLKGQLAINLLSIQKDFPEGARIEIVEDKGLYIMLPVNWATSPDCKDKINTILGQLRLIKVAQQTSRLEK
ncbi:hypothetical protein ACI7Y0_003027 [Vibrio cholerae]